MKDPRIPGSTLTNEISEFSLSLTNAFNAAWDELITNHCSKTLRHVNESVFRYFVIRELLKGKYSFEIEDEWNRIDMLLRTQEKQAAVEFKFYDSRPLNPISGKCRYKGGAGDRNYSEFVHAINRLRSVHEAKWHSIQGANITERYFILVGTKRPENGRKSDFMASYYPAEEISLTDGHLQVIEQKKRAIENAHIFGWLCKVS